MKIVKTNNTRGFTLIELLVAISIIGILASLTLGSYTNAQSRARDTQRKTDLKVVREALEQYKVDRGYYPNQTQAGAAFSTAAQTAALSNTAFVTQFNNTLMSSTDTRSGLLYLRYMSKAVTDPKNNATGGYQYRYAPTNAAGDGYTLETCLENSNDSTAYQTAALAPCATTPTTIRVNYRIFNP